MNLSQALSAAVSGLNASQVGLGIVAANVANSETPGYVRKVATQVQVGSNNGGLSVRIAGINRQLDIYVQRQLRVESSGASYADLRAQFYQRLQGLYGEPGSDSAIETLFNDFTGTLQALTVSPDDPSARSAVLNTAQVFTQQLRALSDGIQGLRSDAELGLSDAVQTANNAMAQIAAINRQLSGFNDKDSATAALLDQRDVYIDQLAGLMDINVTREDNNYVNIFTSGGTQLVGYNASTLTFDAHGVIAPEAQWSEDPAARGVGTITVTSPSGGTIDLIANKAIRSGKIAALLQMRDHDLVQAQAQIDEIAAGMASALSDSTTAGTAVTSGPQSGFDIDIGGLLAGNGLTVNYVEQPGGQAHTLRFIGVFDPSALPLSNTATNDPNDRVVGIDLNGGIGSILGQISAALAGSNVSVSNPSGSTLRFLDDGVGGSVKLASVTRTTTQTTLGSGATALPFFLDGTSSYTGAITSTGSQRVGLAGRLSVNAALIGDPSKLVVYGTGIGAGDPARPNFIYERLMTDKLTFAPDTGIGAEATPFSGTVSSFLRQVISAQGEAANAASSLNQGQQVVLNSLQQRFSESSSVNIDEEMAMLLSLQNAYAANARVMTAVREMLDTLMKA